MPTVGQTIVRSATVGKLEAESWQNPPDLEYQLLHLRMLYCMDRRFLNGKKKKKETEKKVRHKLLLHGLISIIIS
jgi:hypothetical protein